MSSVSDTTLAWRQYRLERHMFWRNPAAAVFNIVIPIIFLVVIGSLAGSQKERDIIVPGIAGMNVLATTFSALAHNMTYLRETGVLKRIHGTPLPTRSYLTALFGNTLVNSLFQILLVVVAGALFFGLPWPNDWFELIVFSLLGIVTFSSLGVAFSYVIPNYESAAAYVNFVYLPAILLGGVFFTADQVGIVLHTISAILPISHFVDGLRAAIISGYPISQHLEDFVILAAWGVFGVIAAVRGFRWE
jgi:ABC-2 type transport system permease protein